MNARERIIKTLNHQETEKVAVDFGSAATTGIAASLLYKLRKHLNFEDIPIKITDPYQMLGDVDDQLKTYIPTDVVSIMPQYNLFGFKNEKWKHFKTFDGTPVFVPEKFNTKPNKKGDLFIYPQGDKNANPSGVMPKGGYYFDSINRQKEIDEDNLKVEDNLEEFTLLTDDDLRYIEKETDNIYKNTEYAIIGNPGTSALGDIALVPAPMLKDPKGIRGVEEWYISTAIRQDYIKEVFDRQSDIAIENFKLYKQAVGNKVVAIYLCGTDFGTQVAPFCSVDTFNELYLPYYKKMTDWIHKNTLWKVFKHSCGAVEPLMESFIEAGFDIINPVQYSATGMDSLTLKEKYGDRIVFWGGGIDTQKILPFGNPEQVKMEVKKQIEIFSKNGGFVFNAIHNVQYNISIENFVAMIEAINEYR